VVTRCDTLQHAATRCDKLQHTATYFNTLQRVSDAAACTDLPASHCTTLAPHCNSTSHCNALQHTSTSHIALQQHCNSTSDCNNIFLYAPDSFPPHHEEIAGLYNTRQHTATHCDILQHTATHCNTLQHTTQGKKTQQYTPETSPLCRELFACVCPRHESFPCVCVDSLRR